MGTIEQALREAPGATAGDVAAITAALSQDKYGFVPKDEAADGPFLEFDADIMNAGSSPTLSLRRCSIIKAAQRSVRERGVTREDLERLRADLRADMRLEVRKAMQELEAHIVAAQLPPRRLRGGVSPRPQSDFDKVLSRKLMDPLAIVMDDDSFYESAGAR